MERHNLLRNGIAAAKAGEAALIGPTVQKSLGGPRDDTAQDPVAGFKAFGVDANHGEAG